VRQALAACTRRSCSASDRRRRGDLLVHRRVDARRSTTGAYRAVEFIKENIKLDGVAKASVKDSQESRRDLHAVRAEGHVQHLPGGLLLRRSPSPSSSQYFFIGYLISIAIFGLYQAIFMANAGGAWDNAKKIVEAELRAKGTELHDATVVGDTVGDPFKDTSSVALNPVIKFTTLFGFLAVELAVLLRSTGERRSDQLYVLAVVFLLILFFLVYRSFYGMRIGED
jgi:K(+)-stimulated pyrophosphate-energized sodium pump